MSDHPSASVTTAPQGPYLLRGPFDLTDAAGNRMRIPAGKSAALCRCGRSSTKPFCDGTHTKTAFDGPEPAPDWALVRFRADAPFTAPPEEAP
jgi:CDGSH iron-sulfur domain-containing protein 3